MYDNEAVRRGSPNAWAHTDPSKAATTGKYTVNFSDWAFNSKLDMFMVMGHEYVHVSQFASGLPYSAVYNESGAYKWEVDVLSKSGKTSSLWYSDSGAKLGGYQRSLKLPMAEYYKVIRAYDPFVRADWGMPQRVPAF